MDAQSDLPYLLVVGPGDQESRFIIENESVLIGRDPTCDIVLDAKRVSRRHAVIQFDGTTASIQDLGSTNGTMLNDDLLLPQAKPLVDGDVVTISPVEITFVRR